MEWLKDAGSLAQTGGIGVALVTLGVLYKVVTNHNTHTNSVIEKSAHSNVELAKAMTANTEVTRSLKEAIDRRM